ncbi:MAG: vWA domain-containing protein [Myxococcota bacterium]
MGAATACGGDDGRDTGNATLPTSLTNASAGTMGGDDSGTADDGGDDDDGDTGTKLDVMTNVDDGEVGGNECNELVDMADVGPRPQDIIIAVDNSGSMEQEAAFVQAQMNSFSVQIAAANVDAHIVLISAGASDDAGVCIQPPLGSGGCPGDDSNPPTYLHVESGVGSNNALERIVGHFPDYSSVLRPTAVTHIVVVTDDDSDMSAQDFISQMAGLAPHLSEFTFHGIIAPEDVFNSCINMTTCCGLAADQGTVYQTLISTTGGVEGNLCEQQFQPIFQAVAQQVIGGATLSCSYEIPPPPDGEVFDKDEVNVSFDDGMGGTLEIGRVDDPANCGGVADGWYYDDPDDPTVILVCPQTCDKIQGFAQATVAIIFGCETIPAG